MDSCKFTPFGLCVKTELLRRGKSQKWLEAEIRTRYQLYADSGYMYKIFTGQRSAPRSSKPFGISWNCQSRSQIVLE